MMAAEVVMFGAGISGMVDNPVGSQPGSADRHVFGQQIQPVAGVTGGVQMRQLFFGEKPGHNRSSNYAVKITLRYGLTPYSG
jgi:hypothetical protein